MTSFPDPDFLESDYDTLVIHFDSPSLYERKHVESFLVNRLRRKKGKAIVAYESSSLIPPTRTWDSASSYSTFLKAGIDGYIHIVEVERKIDSTWVPIKEVTKTTREEEQQRQTHEDQRQEEVKRDTLLTTVEVETTTRSTHGGYWEESIRRDFRVQLIDIPSGRIAWLGVSWFSGEIDDGGELLSKRISAQLERDGFVKAK